MLWPVTDANFDTESYHEYADGYFLSRAMMKWFWGRVALESNVQQRAALPCNFSLYAAIIPHCTK